MDRPLESCGCVALSLLQRLIFEPGTMLHVLYENALTSSLRAHHEAAEHCALCRWFSIWGSRSQPLRLVPGCFASCISHWLCSACLRLCTCPSTPSSGCSWHHFSRHICHWPPTLPSSWQPAQSLSSFTKSSFGRQWTSFCLRLALFRKREFSFQYLHEHDHGDQCINSACKWEHK